ncbi:MAG TPA: hypothetical protein VGD69_06290 [Herpetosiphonaceae bacterium]
MQQTQAIPARYTLDHAGQRIEVEVTAAGLTNTARLLIDGQPVAEQQASLGDRTRLRWQQWTVLVQWGWWSGQVARCVLFEEHDDSEPQPQSKGIVFAPPPGSRAARLAQFQREHPALYAARHVAIAVLQVTLPLLGIGALILGLLPAIDWAWLSDIGAFFRSLRLQIGAWLPSIDLPFFDLRDWLRSWIVWIVRSPVFAWGKWLLPVVIAVFVAIEEFRRHQRSQASAHQPEPADRSD